MGVKKHSRGENVLFIFLFSVAKAPEGLSPYSVILRPRDGCTTVTFVTGVAKVQSDPCGGALPSLPLPASQLRAHVQASRAGGDSVHHRVTSWRRLENVCTAHAAKMLGEERGESRRSHTARIDGFCPTGNDDPRRKARRQSRARDALSTRSPGSHPLRCPGQEGTKSGRNKSLEAEG